MDSTKEQLREYWKDCMRAARRDIEYLTDTENRLKEWKPTEHPRQVARKQALEGLEMELFLLNRRSVLAHRCYQTLAWAKPEKTDESGVPEDRD